MNFTSEQVDFLLTDTATDTLNQLRQADLSDKAILNVIMKLRKKFNQSEASALVETAKLRQQATVKFSDPWQLFFTNESLQQATPQRVALYRAQKFNPNWVVADLGASIGADTIALAPHVQNVIAYEIDPVRARFLSANIERLGLNHKVEVRQADWTQDQIEVNAIFADPARRQDGKRLRGLDQIIPPFSEIERLSTSIEHMAIKLSPGVDYEDDRLDEWEIEVISENGDCKEVLALHGALKSGVIRRATLFPVNISLDFDANLTDRPLSDPQKYIYEPDAAVIRAHLVEELAELLGAFQIDPQIAYLTSTEAKFTPYARIWSIADHAPFSKKQIDDWIEQYQASEVILKKRGSPIDVDDFGSQLKTHKSGQQITIFLTRVNDQHWMILADQELKQELKRDFTSI